MNARILELRTNTGKELADLARELDLNSRDYTSREALIQAIATAEAENDVPDYLREETPDWLNEDTSTSSASEWLDTSWPDWMDKLAARMPIPVVRNALESVMARVSPGELMVSVVVALGLDKFILDREPTVVRRESKSAVPAKKAEKPATVQSEAKKPLFKTKKHNR